jgi:hypothetical protein
MTTVTEYKLEFIEVVLSALKLKTSELVYIEYQLN